MAEKLSCCRFFVFILAISLLFSSSYLHAENNVKSSSGRYRVFSLKQISAQQGKDYLKKADIGTVSILPSPNTLLVTAQARELVKAAAIIKLVDDDKNFVIEAICPTSMIGTLPSNEQIEAEVGDISIGTFSNPPQRSDIIRNRAIIDIHGDSVIAIAPVIEIGQILSAVRRLQKDSDSDTLSAKQGELTGQHQKGDIEIELKGVASPFQTNSRTGTASLEPDELLDSLNEVEQETSESEDLFSKLLSSLKTPENQASEKPKPLTQPEKTTKPVEQQRPETAPGDIEQVKPIPKPEPEPKIKPEPEIEPAKQAAPEIEKPVHVVRSYKPEPIDLGDETLELDLPEKLNVVDLLGLIGEYLKLDYMYDPAKVRGEVTLKVQGPIKVKDLYPLLESVLKFRGFVMARKGNLVTIVPTGEALNIDPALEPKAGEIKFGDVIITRIFNLQHIDTASAKNLLTGMKLGANITSIAGTGTLIVTEYAYRMGRIEKLLSMIDKPGEPKEFRFRQLRYTMAESLAPKIKTLAEQLGTVSITVGAQQAAAPTRRGRKAPAKPAPTPKGQAVVYLDADERTNRILMIGLPEQLIVVDNLIDALDVEQRDLRTLRLYNIHHVGAEEVKRKLEEIGIIGAGQSSTGTKQRVAGAKTASLQPTKITSPSDAPGGLLAGEPQVIIIESTNSLLVNATEGQHAQIAVIIGYVDSETLELAIPYEIYALENQNPEDLAEVLQQLIQETVKDKEGKIERTIKKIEDDIVIVPDESTFSLIVYASKKNQEWIRKLIKQLDKRRPQVLIDVTLVEVSRTDLFDLDIQLATKWPKLAVGGAMEAVSGAVVTPFIGSTGEIFSSPKTGVAQGFYTNDHIQYLLTAMQTKSYGRVLSKPKILVNDGEPGVIQTKDTTNIGITTIIEGGPDKEDIVATEFKPYDAGLTLTITPNISEGDLLLLDIELIRSAFGESPTAGAPPDTVETNISSVVTVPDGHTIILGGIISLNQTKGGAKVPFLGDIPLIGGLFRSTSNTDRESKLYVFVKANILRPEETLKGLPALEETSKRSRAAFERAEEHFQGYEDWPGRKSKPMDPLRVLEVD
ncbi:MAG: hypothetical protein KAS75_08080 [Planctomycetes bacterium]|nr:hypothetical protein [Planctomycetota bacterium]